MVGPSNDSPRVGSIPRRSGRQLAYVLGRKGNNHLGMMNRDGSGQIVLTNSPAAYPVWSPDGRELAFMSSGRGDYSPLYVLNSDGHTIKVGDANKQAAWSPDGQTIASVAHVFSNDGSPFDLGWDVIILVHADGSRPVQVACGHSPAWSPDGHYIAFVTYVGGNSSIAVVANDGSDIHTLISSDNFVGQPVWSPDGGKIAYTGSLRAYIMNADGSHQISVDGGGSPAWAPDGKQLAYEVRGANGYVHIYSMNSDGTGATRLTNDHEHSFDFSPSWSQDGREIAYYTFGDGFTQICIMTAKGKVETCVDDMEQDGTGAPSIAWRT